MSASNERALPIVAATVIVVAFLGLLAFTAVLNDEADECLRNGTAVVDGKRYICVEYGEKP